MISKKRTVSVIFGCVIIFLSTLSFCIDNISYSKIIILLGSPGAGKGTLSYLLSKKLNYRHLSTGDLLREHLEKGTEIGVKYAEDIKRGNYIPSEVIQKIVLEEIIKSDQSGDKLILDGFPRTMEQAIFLNENLRKLGRLSSAQFIYLHAPEELCIERISNRRTCLNCNSIYNDKYRKTKVNNVCDDCSNQLTRRKCDNETDARKRILTFNQNVPNVLEYYKKAGLLISIDSNKISEVVYNSVLSKMLERKNE
jgi:adenylate kinase